MKRRYWKVWGVCFVILFIYLCNKQHDLVVTTVKPEYDSISENADWIFGRFSSGKIVHARECLEIAEGWDAVGSIWPLYLALVVVSLTAGTAWGYYLRGNDNAADHDREISVLEQKYRRYVEDANKKYQEAENKDAQSQSRMREVIDREGWVKYVEKAAEEKVRDIEKTKGEEVEAVKKQLQNLQEDHKNRGHKMEGLEKDKIDLKRKYISNEKEILKLQEDNIALKKENLALKKEK